jgi:3-oxoacyl-[acyl-carrier protein] reductase
MKLQDRVALVTGSSRGIGRAIALKFAEEGAKVVVNYLGSRAEAEAVVRRIEAAGAEAIAVQADVSRADQVQGMIEQALRRFGRIDILVNNAGIYLREDYTEEHWDRVMAVQLKGCFLCTRAVAPVMRRQGRGVIVNISGTAGFAGRRGIEPYAAKSAAIIAFTKSCARALAPEVRVNSVAPGLLETDMARVFTPGRGQRSARRSP